MKKIVITGASGFLGRNLIRRLKTEEGFEVFALSGRPDLLAGKDDNPGNVTYCSKELIRTEEAAEIFENAIVLGCAFPRNTSGEERANGLEYIKDLMVCSEKNRAEAFINISSQSVYSAKRNAPAKESDPVFLDSIYAAEKYAVELMTEAVFARSSTAFTNIRLASLIGPGFDVRIVNRLVRQAEETGEISVTDDEKQFGFMDVADAAEGIAAMLSSDPKNWKKIYNLGIKGAYSLKTIAQSVKEVLGEAGTEVKILLVPGEGSDQSALDAAAFYQDFGFEPRISLKESIRRICLGAN